MRRTQARQVDLFARPDGGGGIKLDAIPCRVCGALGVSIIALGTNDSGAIEIAYCGIPCARTQGWPPWPSEASRD